MRNMHLSLLLCTAGLGLLAQGVQAADEEEFLGQIRPSTEQALGQGHSASWTLSLVATQYQPQHATPELQAALQAQHEGRFLDALIQLDAAGKHAGSDDAAEIALLRASFLLQGSQSQQALQILTPLFSDAAHGADAYALAAMARLQQGKMQQALDAAQHAHGAEGGLLPHLALSYALQGVGRLEEARDVMHGYNANAQSAVALAREAELALTLGAVPAARNLAERARGLDAAQPYVVAVGGLVYLIEGRMPQAKAAFETALQRDPHDAKALLGLGLAETRLGDVQAGYEKLQAANQADPGDAVILSYLGRAQQQLGQPDAAMASWRSAEQADPKDPVPWLFQARAELQANRPLAARESLREAQARLAYRSVYRGESLIREDRRLLQANLAEIQRRLGMERRAFETLADAVDGQDAAMLRNEADLLQGRRFAESARRSLLLQSLFSDRPGSLPAALDIYGDGAGQTGAVTPQHGVVSSLGAQQASYNNYDALFGKRATLAAEAIAGGQNTSGEQVRLGVGNDIVGFSAAQLSFRSGDPLLFRNLDNRVAQAVLQVKPAASTQAFLSYQTFDSRHGETLFPADPLFNNPVAIHDNSHLARLGLRQALGEAGELRALWSVQQTSQPANYYLPGLPPVLALAVNGSSQAHGEELQYRNSGADYATQWGVQQSAAKLDYQYPAVGFSFSYKQKAEQFYGNWQQALNEHWQMELGLGWGRMVNTANVTNQRSWLPRFGAVYTPDAATHVRLAAWRGMGAFAPGDATLAPASLAGVAVNRPGDNGRLVHGLSLGADRQLDADWSVDAQAQRRRAGLPNISFLTGEQILLEQQIDESQLALHWQPQGAHWAATLAGVYEHLQNDTRFTYNDSLDGQRLRALQLSLRWYASERCTVHLAWSSNRVDGTHQLAFNTMLSPYRDSFSQLDADLDWKVSTSATLTAGVRNATNRATLYTEADPLNPRFSQGRLAYAKLGFAW